MSSLRDQGHKKKMRLITIIPRLFHHIWLGPRPMPSSHKTYINGWKAEHKGWSFKLWDDNDLTPDQFANYDLIKAATSYAQKADIMRYEILYKYGGVYLDCDFECLRNINSLLDGITAFSCNEISDYSKYCSTGILGAKPKHPVFKRATQMVRKAPLNTKNINQSTGPYFFRRCFEEGDITIFPTMFFYPFHYDDPKPWPSVPRVSYGIHHWGASWLQEDFDNTQKVQISLLNERRLNPKQELLQKIYLAGQRQEQSDLTIDLVFNTLGKLPSIIINPQKIKYCINMFSFQNSIGQFVPQPPWPKPYAASENQVRQEMLELLNLKGDYPSTNAYKKFVQAISDGKPINRNFQLLYSEEHLDWYFQTYLMLAKNIAQQGFLAHEEKSIMGDIIQNTSTHWKQRDIHVAIGEKGDVFYVGEGQHRTAIAHWLELSAIPAQVRYIHPAWLNKIMDTATPSIEIILSKITELGSDTKPKLSQEKLSSLLNFTAHLNSIPQPTTLDLDVEFLQPALLGLQEKNFHHFFRLWKTYISLVPKQAFHYVQLAEAHFQTRDLDQAHTALNKALEIQPDVLSALMLKGRIFLKQKDWKSSQKHWSRVLVLDPNNLLAHYNLAHTYLQLKQPHKADRVISEILKKEQQQTIRSLSLQARIANQKKNWSQAVHYWSKILELDSNHARAKKAIQNLQRKMN